MPMAGRGLEGAGPARPPGGDRAGRESADYLNDVNAKSRASKYGLPTPLTSLDQMIVVLSQSNGTAGAWEVICLSISAHALRRSAPWSADALFMAWSMAGTSSWARLLFPPSLKMFAPLNVGSSIDCGSVKSLNQPAEPQIATCFLGCWHHSV